MLFFRKIPEILTLVPLAFFVGGSVFAAPELRHTSARVLSSENLYVEIMDPASSEPYYKGVRFSPMADVLRVVMDGHDFLFSPVKHDPFQENGGLAMEFDLFQREFGPPGFIEAAEGEAFLKVGVGVLKKTGEKYACSTPYELIEAARTEVFWKKDSATFHQTSPLVNGYGYILDTTVVVSGRVLTVDYRLQNTGSKELLTEQYAHNFFRFDDKPPGPDYEIHFPYDFEVTIPKPVIAKKENSLVLLYEINPKIKAAQAHVVSKGLARTSDSVVVKNKALGMELHALLSKPCNRFTLHVDPNYLCPEQFLTIRLKPGETSEWKRTYLFKSENTGNDKNSNEK